MAITATPLTPRFGAEISGVDISQPLDEATVKELIAQQDKWGITVYRNTGMDNDAQVRFARYFGYLESTPGRDGGPRNYLFNAGNLGRDGQVNYDPGAMTYRKGDQIWHTDSAFMDERTSYSMLRAVEVPASGGPTWFADVRSAYDDLPQDVKDKIEDLECEYSLLWSRKQGGADLSHEQIMERHRPVHKAVHVHKGSGRKALYLGAHCYKFVGQTFEESRPLIDYLNNHATQEKYTTFVDYAVGDMVIWDNLAVYHKGGLFNWDERRDMRRATVRENPAPDVDDDPFSKLFSNMPKIVPVNA
jgi:alpha-ketoglutarate-dependent 2,4-dichlorophenoxyacetate dioxygenase